MTGEDYYDYLLERAGLYEKEKLDYSNLFHEMHATPFQWGVPMDDNRAIDGMALRKNYTEETGEIVENLGPCTFLEMLVGLAVRCEVDVMHDGYEDHTSVWFWAMLDNSGLSDYDNSKWNATKVDATIHKIIYRKYKENGQGGLFPLKNPVNDQRKVEIWYQLHGWLHENYD